MCETKYFTMNSKQMSKPIHHPKVAQATTTDSRHSSSSLLPLKSASSPSEKKHVNSKLSGPGVKIQTKKRAVNKGESVNGEDFLSKQHHRNKLLTSEETVKPSEQKSHTDTKTDSTAGKTGAYKTLKPPHSLKRARGKSIPVSNHSDMTVKCSSENISGVNRPNEETSNHKTIGAAIQHQEDISKDAHTDTMALTAKQRNTDKENTISLNHKTRNRQFESNKAPIKSNSTRNSDNAKTGKMAQAPSRNKISGAETNCFGDTDKRVLVSTTETECVLNSSSRNSSKSPSPQNLNHLKTNRDKSKIDENAQPMKNIKSKISKPSSYSKLQRGDKRTHLPEEKLKHTKHVEANKNKSRSTTPCSVKSSKSDSNSTSTSSSDSTKQISGTNTKKEMEVNHKSSQKYVSKTTENLDSSSKSLSVIRKMPTKLAMSNTCANHALKVEYSHIPLDKSRPKPSTQGPSTASSQKKVAKPKVFGENANKPNSKLIRRGKEDPIKSSPQQDQASFRLKPSKKSLISSQEITTIAKTVTDRLSKIPKTETRVNRNNKDTSTQLMSTTGKTKEIYSTSKQRRTKQNEAENKRLSRNSRISNAESETVCSPKLSNNSAPVENNKLLITSNVKQINESNITDIKRDYSDSERWQVNDEISLQTKSCIKNLHQNSMFEGDGFLYMQSMFKENNICVFCQSKQPNECTCSLQFGVNTSHLSEDTSNTNDSGYGLLTEQDVCSEEASLSDGSLDTLSTKDNIKINGAGNYCYSRRSHDSKSNLTSDYCDVCASRICKHTEHAEGVNQERTTINCDGSFFSHSSDDFKSQISKQNHDSTTVKDIIRGSNLIENQQREVSQVTPGFGQEENMNNNKTDILLTSDKQGGMLEESVTCLSEDKKSNECNSKGNMFEMTRKYKQSALETDNQYSLLNKHLPCKTVCDKSDRISENKFMHSASFEIMKTSPKMKNKFILSNANCISCKSFLDKCTCTLEKRKNKDSLSKSDINLARTMLTGTVTSGNLCSNSCIWKTDSIFNCFCETFKIDGFIPGVGIISHMTSYLCNKIQNKLKNDTIYANYSNTLHTGIASDLTNDCSSDGLTCYFKESRQGRSINKRGDKEMEQNDKNLLEHVSVIWNLGVKTTCLDEQNNSEYETHSARHSIDNCLQEEHIDTLDECCSQNFVGSDNKTKVCEPGNVFHENVSSGLLVIQDQSPTTCESCDIVSYTNLDNLNDVTSKRKSCTSDTCESCDIVSYTNLDNLNDVTSKRKSCTSDTCESCDIVSYTNLDNLNDVTSKKKSCTSELLPTPPDSQCKYDSVVDLIDENLSESHVDPINMKINESNSIIVNESCTELVLPSPESAVVTECPETCETQDVCRVDTYIKTLREPRLCAGPRRDEKSQSPDKQNNNNIITMCQQRLGNSDVNAGEQKMIQLNRSLSLPDIYSSLLACVRKRRNSCGIIRDLSASDAEFNSFYIPSSMDKNICEQKNKDFSPIHTLKELCHLFISQHMGITGAYLAPSSAAGRNDTNKYCEMQSTKIQSGHNYHESCIKDISHSMHSENKEQLSLAKQMSNANSDVCFHSRSVVAEFNGISCNQEYHFYKNHSSSEITDLPEKHDCCSGNYSHMGSIDESAGETRNCSVQVLKHENWEVDKDANHSNCLCPGSVRSNEHNWETQATSSEESLILSAENKESGYFSSEQSREDIFVSHHDNETQALSDSVEISATNVHSLEVACTTNLSNLSQTENERCKSVSITENKLESDQKDFTSKIYESCQTLNAHYGNNENIVSDIGTLSEANIRNRYTDGDPELMKLTGHSDLKHECSSNCSEMFGKRNAHERVETVARICNEENQISCSETRRVTSENLFKNALHHEQAVCGQNNQIREDKYTEDLKENSNFSDKNYGLSYTHEKIRCHECFKNLHISEKLNTYGQGIKVKQLQNLCGCLGLEQDYCDHVFDFCSENITPVEISSSEDSSQTSNVCYESSICIYDVSEDKTSDKTRLDLIVPKISESKQRQCVEDILFSKQNDKDFSPHISYLTDNAISISSGENCDSFSDPFLDLPEKYSSDSDGNNVENYLAQHKFTDSSRTFSTKHSYSDLDVSCFDVSVNENGGKHKRNSEISHLLHGRICECLIKDKYNCQDYNDNTSDTNLSSKDDSELDLLSETGVLTNSSEEVDLSHISTYCSLHNQAGVKPTIKLTNSKPLTGVSTSINGKFCLNSNFNETQTKENILPSSNLSDNSNGLFSKTTKCETYRIDTFLEKHCVFCDDQGNFYKAENSNLITSEGGESLCDFIPDENVNLNETCDIFVDAEDFLFDSDVDTLSCSSNNYHDHVLCTKSDTSTSASFDSFKDAIEELNNDCGFDIDECDDTVIINEDNVASRSPRYYDCHDDLLCDPTDFSSKLSEDLCVCFGQNSQTKKGITSCKNTKSFEKSEYTSTTDNSYLDSEISSSTYISPTKFTYKCLSEDSLSDSCLKINENKFRSSVHFEDSPDLTCNESCTCENMTELQKVREVHSETSHMDRTKPLSDESSMDRVKTRVQMSRYSAKSRYEELMKDRNQASNLPSPKSVRSNGSKRVLNSVNILESKVSAEKPVTPSISDVEDRIETAVTIRNEKRRLQQLIKQSSQSSAGNDVVSVENDTSNQSLVNSSRSRTVLPSSKYTLTKTETNKNTPLQQENDLSRNDKAATITNKSGADRDMISENELQSNECTLQLDKQKDAGCSNESSKQTYLHETAHTNTSSALKVKAQKFGIQRNRVSCTDFSKKHIRQFSSSLQCSKTKDEENAFSREKSDSSQQPTQNIKSKFSRTCLSNENESSSKHNQKILKSDDQHICDCNEAMNKAKENKEVGKDNILITDYAVKQPNDSESSVEYKVQLSSYGDQVLSEEPSICSNIRTNSTEGDLRQNKESQKGLLPLFANFTETHEAAEEVCQVLVGTESQEALSSLYQMTPFIHAEELNVVTLEGLTDVYNCDTMFTNVIAENCTAIPLLMCSELSNENIDESANLLPTVSNKTHRVDLGEPNHDIRIIDVSKVLSLDVSESHEMTKEENIHALYTQNNQSQGREDILTSAYDPQNSVCVQSSNLSATEYTELSTREHLDQFLTACDVKCSNLISTENCISVQNSDSSIQSAKIKQNKDVIDSNSENTPLILSQNHDAVLCSQAHSVCSDKAGESLQLNEHSLSHSEDRLSNKPHKELHCGISPRGINIDSEIPKNGDQERQNYDNWKTDNLNADERHSLQNFEAISLLSESNLVYGDNDFRNKPELSLSVTSEKDVAFEVNIVDWSTDNGILTNDSQKIQEQSDYKLDKNRSTEQSLLHVTEENIAVPEVNIDVDIDIINSNNNDSEFTTVIDRIQISEPNTIQKLSSNTDSKNRDSIHIEINSSDSKVVKDNVCIFQSCDKAKLGNAYFNTQNTRHVADNVVNSSLNSEDSQEFYKRESTFSGTRNNILTDTEQSNEMRDISYRKDVHSAKSDENDSEICEESNISVALALRREKEKLKEANLETANRKPINRNFRRATTAIILQNRERKLLSQANDANNNTNIVVPNHIKKSKSFQAGCLSMFNTGDNDKEENDKGKVHETDNMYASRRVSDICKSFIDKTQASIAEKQQVRKISPAISPQPHRKFQSWVCKEGKWKRESTDEFEFENSGTRSNDSSTSDHLNIGNRSVAGHNEFVKGVCPVTVKDYEKATEFDKNKIANDNEIFSYNSDPSSTINTGEGHNKYPSPENLREQSLKEPTQTNTNCLDGTTEGTSSVFDDSNKLLDDLAFVTLEENGKTKMNNNQEQKDDILLLIMGEGIEYMDGVDHYSSNTSGSLESISSEESDKSENREEVLDLSATNADSFSDEIVNFKKVSEPEFSEPEKTSFENPKQFQPSSLRSLCEHSLKLLKSNGKSNDMLYTEIVSGPIISLPTETGICATAEIKPKDESGFMDFMNLNMIDKHSDKIKHTSDHGTINMGENYVSCRQNIVATTNNDIVHSENKNYVDKPKFKKKQMVPLPSKLPSSKLTLKINNDNEPERKQATNVTFSEQVNEKDKHADEPSMSSMDSNIPKRIPKLKAIKIKEEEIFEGKPEYTKECNLHPLGVKKDASPIQKSMLSEMTRTAMQIDKPTALPGSDVPKIKQNTSANINDRRLIKSKTFSAFQDIRKTSNKSTSSGYNYDKTFQLNDNNSRMCKIPKQKSKMKILVENHDNMYIRGDTKRDTFNNQIQEKQAESTIQRLTRTISLPDTRALDSKIPVTSKCKHSKIHDSVSPSLDDKLSKTGIKMGAKPDRMNNNQSTETINDEDYTETKGKLVQRSKSLQRTKLLSEIAEVEESNDANTSTGNNKGPGKAPCSGPSLEPRVKRPVTRSNKRRSLSLPTGTLAFGEARIVYKNGHFTIETMDGTELDSSQLTNQQLCFIRNKEPASSQKPCNSSPHRIPAKMLLEPNSDLQREINTERPHLRRQVGKTVLTSNELIDKGGGFDSNAENVPPNQKQDNQQNLPFSRMCSEGKNVPYFQSPHSSKQSLNQSSESLAYSEQMDLDKENESLRDMPLRYHSSSSLLDVDKEEVRRVAQRARRTSSFRQAQEQGSYRLSGIEEDKDHVISKHQTVSLDESQNTDLNHSRISQGPNQNASFFQRMMAKRKSGMENFNLSNFAKQSESAKDFFSKKMSLKGLFRKNKSDSAVGSPLRTQLSSSPSISVFSNEGDADSLESAPSSPFKSKDMRRRHTSADLFSKAFKDATPSSHPDSNCSTPTRDRDEFFRSNSTPGMEANFIVRTDKPTPSRTPSSSSMSKSATPTGDGDQLSIKSTSSASSFVQTQPLEQPHKPKTPKPVGTSPRRNPSGGSQSSQNSRIFSFRDRDKNRTLSVTSLESENSEIVFEDNSDLKCECENLTPTLTRSHKSPNTTSSNVFPIKCELCGKYTAEFLKDPQRLKKFTIGPDISEDHERLRKDTSGRLALLVQSEISASNSNDSGIQHDVSVHSSNESLKGTPESKVRLRRQKSSSPRPERPKSEIGVRWADLDTQEYDIITTPVRRREGSQNIKDRPRPKSDFDDNIQLFDELFLEVLEDFDTDGSSFVSNRMKAFGSENNLQPYCSLRNLYEMKRKDWESNQGKNRRMSTPHPIKSRLQRTPKRLQKQAPLVRSSSMPESLDKVHKRRKLHHLLDFHEASLSKHMDMDECLSDDSDLSFDHISLQEKSLSIQSSHSQLTSMDEEEDNLTYAEALWDHITMDPEELGFRAGDLINVFDMSDKDWWFGEIEDREGWFPAAFVRIRVNQDQFEDELEVMLQPELSMSPKLRRISTINKDQARTNVVNEIISAEREYVKHLKDVVEGYIQHARKRHEMFPEERLSLIFGNIESIYAFAQKFLSQLEMCIDVCPHLSEIGQCFLDNEKGFEIYSDYCNNHPSACEELKELYLNAKYRHFFEACRLLQELVEIPLEGFLLTPVQKICKYPLQLAELLKYTPPEHADYLKVKSALYEMRKIATLINERKRKMESIEKIAAWQHTVADWEGEDLLERSSELIFSGDINKINSAGWSQERYFFLFDHQLIYCKKELLKRHVFSYKGRIDLDHCDIIPLPDGKDAQYNVTLKHGWKLHETHRDKWYLLYTKTETGKDRWLKALADERKRVREDQENDFCVPEHWKQTVLYKVRSQSSIKEKHHTHRPTPDSHIMLKKDFPSSVPYATLPRVRRSTSQKPEKKKGWFNFGGKKSKR